MRRLTGLARDVLSNSAERDAQFRENIAAAALMSLRAIGALEVVVPFLMLAAGLAVIPLPPNQGRAWIPNVLFILLGGLTLASAYTLPGRRWPRLLASLSILWSIAIIVWSALLAAGQIRFLEHYLLGYITLVMFAAAAAVPLQPSQTLLLGITANVFYVGSVLASQRWLGWADRDIRLSQQVFVFVVTLLCTGLNASVYRQRYRGYLDHVRALRTAEELRETQNRLLLADNAAVFGRVAAALSHELNSPVGVLSSAVQTLAALARRMAHATSAERERLERLLEEVTASGRQSAARLQEIVSRIQRFTNLDRAEIHSADLNTLVSDVVALLGSEQRAVAMHQDLHPVPQFLCRPQQMSAVFSNLLSNALDAASAAGGAVHISTRDAGDHIEIRFADNGSGIPAEDLPYLFDPAAFHVARGRVRAGHWSLFTCRQMVREHGGDIELESSPAGTIARVLLPKRSALASRPGAPS